MAQPFILSANISTLFPERPFLDRIDAAADAGFRAVECQFPYAFEAREIADRAAARGLVFNGINTPTGDLSRGEFGLAAMPGAGDRFRAGFERALAYGRTLGVSTIHCMSGAPPAEARDRARETFLENLRWASGAAQRSGIVIVIEPLNARDRPGYFVSRSDEVVGLLEELRCDNVRLLFDVYHIQIMEGDLLRRIERHWPFIGHVQVASVPLRREPDEGEVAMDRVLEAFAERGWAGFVGAEYHPRGSTADGLGWARRWLAR
jgi:2-dehydrotetronate isomerase